MIGRVFVVAGNIEAIGCDDLVVSTDNRGVLGVKPHWWKALGWGRQSDRSAAAPVASAGRWTHLTSADIASMRPGTWLLDVGAAHGDGLAWLMAGIEEVLTAIANQPSDNVPPGRPRRVAMPVPGVRGGGFGRERGRVIAALLGTVTTVAAQHQIDVIIVANSPSDYSALQAHRRDDPAAALPPKTESEATRLAGLAARGQLALFMGAGTGLAAGLPTWDGLLTRLAEDAHVPGGPAGLRGLNPLDAADLLRKQLNGADRQGASDNDALGRAVARIIRRPARYVLSHALLAALDVDQAITTNFDDLFEEAVEDRTKKPPRVLLPIGPSLPVDSDKWLLKLHGDAGQPGSIVLDRRAFVRFDAEYRPLASVLQATLLTKHVLVVGASLNDDNVIRLIHEVATLNEARDRAPEMGTVLALEADPVKEALWQPELRHLALGPARPAGETDLARGARMLAAGREVDVLLDRIAQKVSSGAAHLLDTRYAGPLSPTEQQTAQTLAGLVSEVRVLASQGTRATEWGDVLAALQRWGAR